MNGIGEGGGGERAGGWEEEASGGTGAWGGVEFEAAAVGGDDGGGAGEAEAEVAGAGSEVRLEEAVADFRRDPLAGVGHVDGDPSEACGGIVEDAGGDAEEAALGHGVFGVFEQGEQGIAEGRFIDLDGWEVAIEVEFELGAAAEESGGDPPIEEGAEIGGAEAGGGVAGASETGEGLDG